MWKDSSEDIKHTEDIGGECSLDFGGTGKKSMIGVSIGVFSSTRGRSICSPTLLHGSLEDITSVVDQYVNMPNLFQDIPHDTFQDFVRRGHVELRGY